VVSIGIIKEPAGILTGLGVKPGKSGALRELVMPVNKEAEYTDPINKTKVNAITLCILVD
jgi:hypothetical protein